MGTNYYTINTDERKIDHMDPEFHIGKRSAAGMYCWNCGLTLCKDGEEFVHHNKKDVVDGKTYPADAVFADYRTVKCKECGQMKKLSYWELQNVEWHKKCPKCGKKPTKEKLAECSAGRELGFNKDEPKKKTGVASCSSFSWAMKREDLEKKFKNKEIDCVYNEYGDKYTLKEFLKILEECPIQYERSLGKCFS